MLHEMLQFQSVINIYKIVLGYNVTQLKGNTIPLTASIFYVFTYKKTLGASVILTSASEVRQFLTTSNHLFYRGVRQCVTVKV